MAYKAVEIANEFLKLSGRPLDQMKLQKLVFMAHGWNLVINKAPLVSDRIEAWAGGPVFRSIWDHIKYFGLNTRKNRLVDPDTREEFCPQFLSGSEKLVIEHVWKKYGIFSGRELSDITHQKGTPWFTAYYGRGRNSEIGNQDIELYYRQLAMAGRESQAH